MRDLVTQSELQSFCDCRVKHKIAYDDLQKLRLLPLPFYLGSLFHKWLELYYKGTPSPLKQVVAGFQADFKKLSANDIEAGQRMIPALGALAEAFPKVDPVKKFKLKVSRVETSFEVVSPLATNRALGGRIDLVAIDPKGRVWVQDNKLVSRIDTNLVDSFRLNAQVQQYLLAIRLDPELKTLGRVGGFIPNLIRKPALRQGEKESDDAFSKRVVTAILKEPEDYFWSEQQVYEEDVSRRFEETIFHTAQEMRRSDRHIYPNFGQCVTIYGRCPFHAICSNTPGWEALYTKKCARHEELQPKVPPVVKKVKLTKTG